MSFRTGARVGIDFGFARIGVAVTDPHGSVVIPKCTVRFSRYGTHLDEIADIIEDISAIEVVIGLPRHLSGAEGASAKAARKFARELAVFVPEVRICVVDERLTSNQAHSDLATMGIDNRARRNKVDQLAAAIILEQALDVEKNTGKLPGETIRPGR
ncbi:MAG: Holliday junction resolvase RuvX [Actinomycetaceae bacterium]|nr:Holliday junction resolvase RuvX [Actinomycetaceae bacterium]